jgi:hypothetical protein
MYEFASALIVAGDTADPTRALHWAFNTQQQSNGTWTASITVPTGATVINTAFKN